MTNNFSPNQFLREKRLSNAYGRGLCKANAGHAPREIVSRGRGIVGDAAQSWCDRPDDRFWSVSHIRRRYTKLVYTSFPLQLYGYPTVTADLYLRAFLGGYPSVCTYCTNVHILQSTFYRMYSLQCVHGVHSLHCTRMYARTWISAVYLVRNKLNTQTNNENTYVRW
jgi:hypothetical protein